MKTVKVKQVLNQIKTHPDYPKRWSCSLRKSIKMDFFGTSVKMNLIRKLFLDFKATDVDEVTVSTSRHLVVITSESPKFEYRLLGQVPGEDLL